MTSSVVTSSAVAFSGAVAVNLALAATMQHLWGMISAMQILSHIPMFNFWTPFNINKLFVTVISVVNMDLLPIDNMIIEMFDLQN